MMQLQQAVQQKLINRNIRLIGLGGIGGILARFLARFLETLVPDSPLYLIDGDTFELRNRARMEFHSLGNKAVVIAQQLAQACPRLRVLPIPAYVSPANISELITTGDICFAMVDNHTSRQLLATHCQALPDIVLLSGGNDGVDATHHGTFGNCQLFVRHQGVSLTNAPTRYHPEIAQAQDQAPYALSCGELMQTGAEQLLFTNLAVASAMLNAFLGWLLQAHPPYEEVYLDVLLGRVIPVTRQIA
jgi:hypothetical protein